MYFGGKTTKHLSCLGKAMKREPLGKQCWLTKYRPVLVQGGQEAALKVSHQLKLFTTATSLGGVESLIEHRKSVEGPDSSTPENLLRLSVGLENETDLINDWQAALATLR